MRMRSNIGMALKRKKVERRRHAMQTLHRRKYRRLTDTTPSHCLMPISSIRSKIARSLVNRW